MALIRWLGAFGLAAASVPCAATPIPFKRDPVVGAANIGGGALGVLLVSLLAIGAVLYLRKRLHLQNGAAPGERALNVMETQRLGPKALLSVVEFDGKRYLIAQGEHGVSCLATSDKSSAGAACR